MPKIVYDLSRAQAAHGHSVKVFTTNFNKRIRKEILLDSPISCDDVSLCYYRARLRPRFALSDLVRALSGAVRNGEFDVLHGHCPFLSLNVALGRLARSTAVPVFFHTHGTLDPVILRFGLLKRAKKLIYIRLVERRILNSARAVFANTDREKAQVRDAGVDVPIVVLPNGVDPRLHPSAAEKKRFLRQFPALDGHDIILYLGRIHPKKGLEVLVQAFHQLCRNVGNVALVIAGDREEFPSHARSLDALARKGEGKGRVLWTGFLDEKKKVSALSAATVFSHVSMSEGMSLSILESMAMGIPTMVGKGCSMGDAARHGAVWECDCTVPEVVDSLTKLIGDESVRESLSQCALEFAREHHDWARIAERCVDAYERGMDAQAQTKAS